jgi:hypothetical protein
MKIRTIIAAALLSLVVAGPRARAQSLPDLRVRMIRVTGDLQVTVYVANYGHAASSGCYVVLYVLDPSDKKAVWQAKERVEALNAPASVGVAFDTQGVSLGGKLLVAVADSTNRVAEEDEENNRGQLLVPESAAPPGPTSAPAPAEKPKLSPDIAVVNIKFGTYVTVVLKNVGDRDYHALDAGIKDSFKRAITLKRIVHNGAQQYTQELGTRYMGNTLVGQTFESSFKYPPKVVATSYTWIVTIEGQDPDTQNNTFKKVTEVTKID